MQVEGHKSHTPQRISWPLFLQKSSLALACLLLASAGMSWLAANWEHLGNVQKLAGTQVLLVLLVFLAWRRKATFRTSGARDFTPFAVLIALAAVTVGGLLALVGQIYQTGADPWELFLLWAVLLLPWLLVARTVFLGLLCALLLNLAAARYMSLLDGRFWFGATLHWATAGLVLALVNAGLLALWEVWQAKLGDAWRIGPRMQAMAMAGWLIVAVLAGFDTQAGPIAPAAIGLMAMAAMYRAYTLLRPDLVMVSLAAGTAFLLFAVLLLRWADSEGALLLVITVLTAVGGLALRQLSKLIGRQAQDAEDAQKGDDEAVVSEPWHLNLFRLAIMGLTAVLCIAFLFMTLSPAETQWWLAGLLVAVAGLMVLRGVGGWGQAFGMTLCAAGLLLMSVGLYVLDDLDPLLRAGGALLVGAAFYGLVRMASLRFLYAIVVLGLVCALTWPGHAQHAPYDLFDGGPAGQYLAAYVRLWWLAVAAVLALSVARRANGREFCLPLAWACICLAQIMAWITPAPTVLGLGEVWRGAPSIVLIWLGCAMLPVAALWALLAGHRHIPRRLVVTAPLGLAVACLGWMGAPGVSLALLWIVLGNGLRQRSLLAFGVLALLAYLSRFYYQMDATLTQKALVLGLTGLWLLLAWWVLRAKATGPDAAPDVSGDEDGTSATVLREARSRQPGTSPALGQIPARFATVLTASLATGLFLVLLVVNSGIYQRERILAVGQTVVLALAPVDPRSLMQGDYMALRFAAADEARQALDTAPPALAQAIARKGGGWLVLRADDQGVHHVRAVSASLENPVAGDVAAQAPDIVLAFSLRHGRVHIVTDAWFFSEGQAARYEQARYGELRVNDRGTGLLRRLLDAQRQPLP